MLKPASALPTPAHESHLLHCQEFRDPVVNITIIKKDRPSIKLEEKIN